MQPQMTQIAQMKPRMVRRAIVTCFLLVLISTAGIHAQSLEQWTTWGDKSMERGEYYGASRFYAGALAMEGGRMGLQWKMAEACRLSNQYDKAAEYYERVYRKDQGRTHPEALRWLGEMQLCLGLYDAAEATWNKVLQKERGKDTVTAQRAKNALAGCSIGREALAAPKDITFEHLSPPVNTYDSEFGARIGPDSALYFSSLRGELNKDGEVVDTAAYRTVILRATALADGWTEPTQLPDAINGLGDNGNVAWTLDGSQLLFTRCVPGSPCRIHMAPIHDGTYGEAIPLPGLGDELHSTQPMVVHWEDREMLLFVSDRPGGVGGMDIWQARLEEGRAVEVYPLGPPVNSPGDERAPWYDAASSTLWFSSDFLPGMGGYDVFTSTFANDMFATPVHAGAPLNSPANDLYPVWYAERKEGWLTSNRIGSLAAKGETCCNDLYRFRLPEEMIAAQGTTQEDTESTTLNGTTPEAAALSRLATITRRFPLKLYFHNDDPDPRSWETRTSQDYGSTYRRYRSLIPEYEREGDAEALAAFFRDEVDKGFLDLAELLITLRELLDQGTSLTLVVRGHASPLAANDYNRNLSMRRISSLENHLRMALGGALRPYVDGTAANGARIALRPVPFGEEQAAEGVSDDLGDLRRSVYSVAAARERRIAVEAVELQGLTGNAAVEEQQRDLGQLKQDQERTITFMVRNRGDRPMRLLDSKADCGCTAADLPQGDIAPGQEVPVQVHFNGRAPEGPLDRTVTIRTNGTPERIDLTITGTVVP
jgi:tetratricopeptide (TPR) repeat protein